MVLSIDGLLGKKLKSNTLNANGALEDRPRSDQIESRALEMYESIFQNVKQTESKTWEMTSQDNKVMTDKIIGASVLFNRMDLCPWIHSNKKIEPGALFESEYNDNNITRTSNILNIKTDEQTQNARMWFKPKNDEYSYEEWVPKEITNAIHFKTETTVFIGCVHYDVEGNATILNKEDMTRSFEICVSNGKSNAKGGHGFLDFIPTDEYACITNRLSLAQFVCPKRRKGSQHQDSFSMAIKFNCNASSGTYEPVVFILLKEKENSNYHLVPVVKYDLIVLNNELDNGLNSVPFESSSSTGHATSMQKRKRAANATTSSKRTHVSSSFDDKLDRIEAHHEKLERLLIRVVNHFSIPDNQNEQPTDH